MCFSSTASFAMGGALVPMGLLALAKTRQVGIQWVPFALYPLAFGIQQLAEGFVWIAIHAQDAEMLTCSSRGFLFFSHFFWPAFAPISVWACEPDPRRRRWVGWLSVLGIFYGLLIFVPTLAIPGWTIVEVVQQALVYKTPALYEYPVLRLLTRVIYAGIVLAALFLSSRPPIQLFAALITLSLALTFVFYAYAFISVWCFFAAILSIYLLGVILREARDATRV